MTSYQFEFCQIFNNDEGIIAIFTGLSLVNLILDDIMRKAGSVESFDQ